MEHLDRLVKTSLQGLGAKKNEKVISTIGKVVGVIGPVLENFDEENKVSSDSGSHRTASIHNDMAILLKELKTMFSETPSRQHVSVRAPLRSAFEIVSKLLFTHKKFCFKLVRYLYNLK